MGGLSEEDLRRRYKVVLSNPPFAGVLPKESIRRDLPTNSKKSELLFLGVVMESLAPGGRAAVIVPEGLLFGSTTGHVDLRRKLVEDFDLQAVVSLPAGVFKPYAGVKTAILVFHKPISGREGSASRSKNGTRSVWFYEVKNDGFDPDKIVGGGRQATPEKNDLPDLLAQWWKYKATRFEQPPGVETGTLLEPGTPEPVCWWASTAELAENDFNLAAGRYKPQVADAGPKEDPAELIRETLKKERSIVSPQVIPRAVFSSKALSLRTVTTQTFSEADAKIVTEVLNEILPEFDLEEFALIARSYRSSQADLAARQGDPEADERFFAPYSCGQWDTSSRRMIWKIIQRSTRSAVPELTLMDKRTGTIVSHRDIGIGVSQLLPVLVKAYAKKDSLVAIEQPEIHLHPALQAELADIFIESALGDQKNTFVLETHSEHILLRLMKRMRQTHEQKLRDGALRVTPDQVSLLFVSPGTEGSVVQDLGLNERGELVKAWPGGFFEEGFNEMFD